MAISIEKISEISAVSGNETPILEYLVPLIEKRCDSLEIDSIGNIIAFKKGIKSSKKVMLATHIDEVGFIVSDITEKGFIKFKAVGDIDPRSLVSKKVSIAALNGAGSGVIGGSVPPSRNTSYTPPIRVVSTVSTMSAVSAVLSVSNGKS